MRRTRGFTLIELAVVIVILAVMVVTVTSKFIGLSSEARVASLQGMKATLESGTSLIYLKAQIDSQTSGDGTITQDGISITLHSGYPTGYWQNSMRYIAGLDSVDWSATNDTVCAGDWCGKGNQTYLSSGITTTTPVVIGKVFPEGYSYNDECGVYYINYRNGARPAVGLETDDCD